MGLTSEQLFMRGARQAATDWQMMSTRGCSHTNTLGDRDPTERGYVRNKNALGKKLVNWVQSVRSNRNQSSLMLSFF